MCIVNALFTSDTEQMRQSDGYNYNIRSCRFLLPLLQVLYLMMITRN